MWHAASLQSRVRDREHADEEGRRGEARQKGRGEPGGGGPEEQAQDRVGEDCEPRGARQADEKREAQGVRDPPESRLAVSFGEIGGDGGGERVRDRVHKHGRQVEHRHGEGGIIPVQRGGGLFPEPGGGERALDEDRVEQGREACRGGPDRHGKGETGDAGERLPCAEVFVSDGHAAEKIAVGADRPNYEQIKEPEEGAPGQPEGGKGRGLRGGSAHADSPECAAHAEDEPARRFDELGQRRRREIARALEIAADSGGQRDQADRGRGGPDGRGGRGRADERGEGVREKEHDEGERKPDRDEQRRGPAENLLRAEEVARRAVLRDKHRERDREPRGRNHVKRRVDRIRGV